MVFSVQVEKIDAEIAALFWPSKVEEEAVEEVTSGSLEPERAVEVPVKRFVELPAEPKPKPAAKRAERMVNTPPPAILSGVTLKPTPTEPLPAVIATEELRWIARAVHARLSQDVRLWDRRMEGEGELSYGIRVNLVAHHLGSERAELRSRLNNPEFMDALARHDPIAADFIGYDFAVMDLMTAQVTSDVFSRSAKNAVREMADMRFYMALQAIIRDELSIDYGEVMARVGKVVARSDGQPFAPIRASMHYRRLYHEYAASEVGKAIGPPPTP